MMNPMMDIRVTVNQAIPGINVKKVILLGNIIRYSNMSEHENLAIS